MKTHSRNVGMAFGTGCLAVSLLLTGAAQAQMTFSGSITNLTNGAGVTNATVAFWVNSKTNWVAGVDDAADGWVTVHAQGSAAGAYSKTITPSPTNIEIGVIALGFQRGAVRVDPLSPATAQTNRFGLTPGATRIEVETDTDVTCSEHGYGGRPLIIADPAASNGRHLRLVHYWTRMNLPLYIPKSAEYHFATRYNIGSAANGRIWLMPWGWAQPPSRTWPATGGAWTNRTVTLMLDAGWYTDFMLQSMDLNYTLNDYADYVEITQGDPLRSATLAGNVTSNGVSAVTYPTVSWIRDGSTNWPGSIGFAEGTAAGAYTVAASACRNVTLVCQALGYQRLVTNVAPVASGTYNFALTPGKLRIEAESDPRITCQAHDEGWRAYIIDDAGSSQGQNLLLSHHWGWLYNRLYLPHKGEYKVTLRYRLDSGRVDLRLNGGNVGSWSATAGAWTTSSKSFVTYTPGWQNIDLYWEGQNKGTTLCNIDYAEIELVTIYPTATVTGTVRTGGAAVPYARIGVLTDSGVRFPGCTYFADAGAAGAYSVAATAGTRLDLIALAFGYNRQVRSVTPVANATRDFDLTAGPLRIEPETDAEVTHQMHGEGYVPSIGSDASCSEGTYLIYPHYWGNARVRLYVPKADKYRFRIRYRTRGANVVMKVNDATVWTLPATGESYMTTWSDATTELTVAAGWANFDIRIDGADKAKPGAEGVDFLQIWKPSAGSMLMVR